MSIKLHYEVKKQVCSCCGVEKPITEFYPQAYTGLPSNQCKTCTNVKRSVQRNKLKHSKFVSKEKIRDAGHATEYSLEDWKDAMLHFRGECCYCGVKEGRASSGSTLCPSVVEATLPGRTSCLPVDAATAVEEIARCLRGSEPKSSGMLTAKRSW